MDFVRVLLRLAAQKQSGKAKNGLEERTDCVVLTHTKHIIQRHCLECKNFFASGIFYFYRQKRKGKSNRRTCPAYPA
jgi:hypothetical protein